MINILFLNKQVNILMNAQSNVGNESKQYLFSLHKAIPMLKALSICHFKARSCPFVTSKMLSVCHFKMQSHPLVTSKCYPFDKHTVSLSLQSTMHLSLRSAMCLSLQSTVIHLSLQSAVIHLSLQSPVVHLSL